MYGEITGTQQVCALLGVGVTDVLCDLGRAVQVDPIKPKMKPPETKRLKLKHNDLLSSFAFNFNWHRCIWGAGAGRSCWRRRRRVARVGGRGLHSLTSELNLRTFGTHRSRLSST
jgi:hypothetical protein